MDAAIIWDEAYSEHETGAHPEGADRIDSLVDHLRGSGLWPRLTVTEPVAATDEDVLLVHTRTHLNLIKRAAQSRGQWIDPDTHVSARSYEIALLSIGGAIRATELWDDHLVPFALIRPPGHHATPDRAMGFCLFNNTAIAARRLLNAGMDRIAILDWDVHHGNGTQAVFYAEPSVLFCSMHQWPHFPGSGFFTECGEGEGEGFTVNLPLPAGANDGDYVAGFTQVVEPITRLYRPDAILVSAGQDIHREDPLGDMVVTEAGFAAMALRCLRMAQDLCDGKLAFILEGGYDRSATGRSVEAILRAVLDETAPDVGEGTARGAAAIERARTTQAAYWEI